MVFTICNHFGHLMNENLWNLTTLTNLGRFLRMSARNPHKGGVIRPSWGVTRPNTIHLHPSDDGKSTKIYENLRKSTKINENLRKSTKINENLRTSTKIYENLRKSSKINENRRKSTKIYENLRKTTKINENQKI